MSLDELSSLFTDAISDLQAINKRLEQSYRDTENWESVPLDKEMALKAKADLMYYAGELQNALDE